jgi:transposase
MERSSQGLVFVGIDVAKDRLDVHLRPAAEAFAVGRDGPGLAALTERLAAIGPTLVVLEATGGFEIAVAAALAAAGLPLAVVNPRQIRDFARATGAWPRPTGSTPRPSRGSPRRSDRSRARCRTRRRGRSASWSAAAGRSSR